MYLFNHASDNSYSSSLCSNPTALCTTFKFAKSFLFQHKPFALPRKHYVCSLHSCLFFQTSQLILNGTDSKRHTLPFLPSNQLLPHLFFSTTELFSISSEKIFLILKLFVCLYVYFYVFILQ